MATPRAVALDEADTLPADVAARLRPACAHLDPEVFETLVRAVVAFKRRWAARDGVGASRAWVPRR